MRLTGGTDGAKPLRPDGIERLELRIAPSARMAVGTLACPRCDAPVAPGPEPLAPSDALRCPVCDHGGAVRDFLSLASPARPAKVHVRVVAGRRLRIGG